jgi:hypothetical protein
MRPQAGHDGPTLPAVAWPWHPGTRIPLYTVWGPGDTSRHLKRRRSAPLPAHWGAEATALGGPAADAQRDMKRLMDASLAVDGTPEPRRPGQSSPPARHEYHSAILIGRNQAAARAGPLMRKHPAMGRRLLAREDDYLRFTTDPRCRLTTTPPNAKSACASCGSRSPAAWQTESSPGIAAATATPLGSEQFAALASAAAMASQGAAVASAPLFPASKRSQAVHDAIGKIDLDKVVTAWPAWRRS